MLENLYTTKMSMDKKKLQNRFSKIRSKNGRISKLMALIIFAAILIVMACVTIIIAIKVNPNGYYMTGNEFYDYINRPIGAIMADIDYADDNKIVFHYAEGFFIDNLQTEEIDHSINLKRLDIAYNQQGSSVLEIKIDKAGKHAYLAAVGPADEIKGYKSYIINLDNGDVKEGLMPENIELFTGATDTFTTIQKPVGWFSDNCIVGKEKTYYLTSQTGTVNGILLATVNNSDNKNEMRYVFGDNYVSKAQEIKTYTPADIKDITDVELVVGGIKYPLMVENAQKEIETTFSTAEKIKMGATACPFSAELIFTRKDGEKGRVAIATDSCAVFKSDNTYYDYSDKDNSILFGYFGLEWNDLINKSYMENSEITVRNFYKAFAESDFETMKSLGTENLPIDTVLKMCYGLTRAELLSIKEADNDEFLKEYLASDEHKLLEKLTDNEIALLKQNSDVLKVYTVTVFAESNIKGEIKPPFEKTYKVMCRKQPDRGNYLVDTFFG